MAQFSLDHRPSVLDPGSRAPITATCIMAAAMTVPAAADDCIVFDDFSDVSNMTVEGDAAVVESADGLVLRLAPAVAGPMAGSSFFGTAIPVDGFSTSFSFRISDADGGLEDCNTESGGDGLVFVFQTNVVGLGGAGQGIGYSGIAPSLGIEFDTWCNSFNNDPSSNHVGIVLDGVVDHGAGAPFAWDVSPDFDNGEIWYVWIDYDGTTVEVRLALTDDRPDAASASRDVDLTTILGQDTAYVGFTSGSWNAWGNHDILQWSIGCGADSDGDGLLDGWEVHGIPYTDESDAMQHFKLDTNGDGTSDANFRHKDLFVEVDAMTGMSLSDGARDKLVFAFETGTISNPDDADGITLHLLRDETDLDHVEQLDLSDGIPDDFYDYKACHFGTDAEQGNASLLVAKAKAYRYCLVADRSDPRWGGIAERPGNDFIVFAGGGAAGDDERIAAIFMHELGHNLGLRHGGFDNVQGKTNYPSIMNYAMAYRYGWNRTFWRLDFQRHDEFEGFIDEAAIDESAGIGTPGGFYAGWLMPYGIWELDENGDPQRVVTFVRLDGRPTDFGDPIGEGFQDGSNTDTVAQDLNYVVDPPNGVSLPTSPSPGQTFVVWQTHDWDNLLLAIPDEGDLLGGPEIPEEITWDAVEWIDENFPDPPCLVDLDRDDDVDVADLLLLLGAWGTTDPTRDVAPEGGDDMVNTVDLLALLAAWGDCE